MVGQVVFRVRTLPPCAELAEPTTPGPTTPGPTTPEALAPGFGTVNAQLKPVDDWTESP